MFSLVSVSQYYTAIDDFVSLAVCSSGHSVSKFHTVKYAKSSVLIGSL